jgi:LPXTG-motif cell wall-anchored protein
MKKILISLLLVVLIVSSFSLFASAEELTNVAQGKHYTLDIGDGTPGYGVDNGYGDGVDAVNQRLTDGVIGEASGAITSSPGVGLAGAQKTTKAIYVIDLGSVVTGIQKFNMDMYSKTDWGIAPSVSVEYAVSEDGITYTTVGTVLLANATSKGSGVEGEWVASDYILELTTAVSARYVKMTAIAGNYVWSTEMQVFANTGAASTDTSSVASTANTNSTASTAATSSVASKAATSSIASSTAPKTGDDNGMIMFAILAVATVSFGIIITKKRISQN